MNTKTDILVGKIVAPQGIRGEVRVQTFSQTPGDFANFLVQSTKFNDGEFHFVRVVPNTNVIIARIDGITNRNSAELLRGTELFINRSTLPATNDNEYYQTDLIGFTVVHDDVIVGTVQCFQNFGAGDIIETENGDMFSFRDADVDLNNKTIIVK